MSWEPFSGRVRWHQKLYPFFWNHFSGRVCADAKIPPFPFLAECALTPQIQQLSGNHVWQSAGWHQKKTPFSGKHVLSECPLAPHAQETFSDMVRVDTKLLKIEHINPSSKRAPAPCRLEMFLLDEMGSKMGAATAMDGNGLESPSVAMPSDVNGDGNGHQWRRQWT